MQKHSKKRAAIYAALCASQSHPTAEAVHAQLKPEYPDLSLGTVYRNIARFKAEGRLLTVDTVGGKERLDADVTPHTHFICGRCGAVSDLPSVTCPPALSARAEEVSGGAVTRCALVFHGVCADCLQRENGTSNE